MKCTIYLENMVQSVKSECKFNYYTNSKRNFLILLNLFVVGIRQKLVEQHLLFMKIYSMQRMLVIIYLVSTFVIDIWLYSIINQTRHLNV